MHSSLPSLKWPCHAGLLTTCWEAAGSRVARQPTLTALKDERPQSTRTRTSHARSVMSAAAGLPDDAPSASSHRTPTDASPLRHRHEVLRTTQLTDLPAELIVAIATYMLTLDRVRLGTTCKAFNFAVYGAPSLWRTFSRRLERLSETSFRVHEPFRPCAGRLTDAALHALLLRCRAADLTTELSLCGCVQVTGSGLIPLAGKTARSQSVSQFISHGSARLDVKSVRPERPTVTGVILRARNDGP